MAHEHESLELEAIAAERADAEALLAELRELVRELDVYRGKVIEVGSPTSLRVRELPSIERAGIVLPEGLLERVERHTAGAREELHAVGGALTGACSASRPPATRTSPAPGTTKTTSTTRTSGAAARPVSSPARRA